MQLLAIHLVLPRSDRCAGVGSPLAGDFSSAIASKLASYDCINPAKATGSRTLQKSPGETGASEKSD